MNINFFAPTQTLIGNGCVLTGGKLLSSLGKRCIIVTGKNSAKASGALADAVSVLEEQNIAYDIFDSVRQNPTVSSCKEAGEIAKNFKADFILGIGGGSALDAAKAVAVFSSNDLDENGLYSYNWKKAPLPVVCIGTTAGTGSEVTPVSVLTASDNRKKSIRDDRIYPVLSFGDAKYTASLPDSFTRSCAVDALSHSVESYFSKSANDVSQMFSIRSCELLLPLLEKGTENLTSQDRDNLYLASVYAGYAISVTGTAFPHAMGYFLSEEHGIPHGTACGVYLPDFLLWSQHSAADDAKNFSIKTGYDIGEVINIVKRTTPTVDVHLGDSDIAALYPRWIDNKGLLRSPGSFLPDDANALLIKLFKHS